jgi:hypothetical protein
MKKYLAVSKAFAESRRPDSKLKNPLLCFCVKANSRAYLRSLKTQSWLTRTLQERKIGFKNWQKLHESNQLLQARTRDKDVIQLGLQCIKRGGIV